jgi:hypothetical protein
MPIQKFPTVLPLRISNPVEQVAALNKWADSVATALKHVATRVGATNETATGGGTGGSGSIELIVPAEMTPVDQTVSLPGPLRLGWSDELQDTVFSGPIGTNSNVGSLDYEGSETPNSNVASLTATTNFGDINFFSTIDNTGSVVVSGSGTWTRIGTTNTYYQITPKGTNVSAIGTASSGGGLQYTAGALYGFQLLGSTAPAGVFSAGGAFSNAGTSLGPITFPADAPPYMIVVTFGGLTDGSYSGCSIVDPNNTWEVVTSTSGFQNSSGWHGAGCEVFYCAAPAAGTYSITFYVNIATTQSITGVNVDMYSLPTLTDISGVPSFKPLKDLLGSVEVSSVQSLTGDIGINSPNNTITVTTSGQNIGLDVTSPLPKAYGGTGTTTPNIVGGTDITVTGTWPNQTVAFSGSSGAAQANYWMFPEQVGGVYSLSSSATWTNPSTFAGTANSIRYWAVLMPYQITATHVGLCIATADNTNSYDIGFYNSAGTLLANVGPTIYNATSTATAPLYKTFTQGNVNIGPGLIYFAITSSSTGSLAYGVLATSQGSFPSLINRNIGINNWLRTTTTSTSSTLPSTIVPTTFSTTSSGGGDIAQTTAATIPIFNLAAF